MKTIKCVVVGDSVTGKTSLIISYKTNEFKDVLFIDSIYDVIVKIDGKLCRLSLVETKGHDEYDLLRPLSYYQTDVFLVCYSVVKPHNFERTKDKWVPEITHYQPKTPFLLVGTQKDYRNDPFTVERLATMREIPVSQQQGEELAKQLKALKYVECSARTREGVENVINEAILAALKNPECIRGRAKKCVLF